MPAGRSAALAGLLAAAAAAVPATAASAAPAHAPSPPKAPNPPHYDTTAPGAIQVDRTDEEVAPGLTLTTFDTYDASGFVRVHVHAADLRRHGLRPNLVASGGVSDPQPLSTQANATGAVAAVNADFFNINETNATLGPEIQSGLLRKGLSTPGSVTGVGTDGIARLANVFLQGRVKVGTSTLDVGALNSQDQPTNGVAVFTPTWGHGDRTFISAAAPVTEVVVQNGKVTAVRDHVTSDAPPAGGMILVGQGTAATTLAAAKPGDKVALKYGVRSDAPTPLEMAVGTRTTLVSNGTVATIPDNADNDAFRPRTAIGFANGGHTLLLTAVDGGAAFSRGYSIQEMAELEGRLGASNAELLDGGGSTTLVARDPGETGVSLQTFPSDGTERAIPTGVGLFEQKGSGRLDGMTIHANSTRVFPGITRQFTANGYDETRAPVEATPTWSTSGGIGSIDRDGVLHAKRPGTGTVVARDGRVTAKQTVQVLGPLADLAFDTANVTLTAGGTQAVHLTGKDAEGFDAPIDPADAQLSYDRSVISVALMRDGSLVISGAPGAAADGQSTSLTATVDGVTTSLPVALGLRDEQLSDFEDASSWRADAIRATSSVAVVPAPDVPGAAADNHALQLNYDYTNQPAGTSAAYATALPGPITLPAGTQRLSLWVRGDGRLHWLRATMRSEGTTNVPFTFAMQVDWTGWRRVEGDIPTGFSAPITLTQIYYVETSTLNRNAGSLEFDDLEAEVAPGEETSQAPPAHTDPYVTEQGGLPGTDWKFAVLADLHTSAAQGADSFSGQQAIEALREAVAAKPAFIVLNGDVVDTDNVEDFQFFDRLIDQYVPKSLPVYWTPGDHESGVTTTGTLDNFRAVTGRPTQSVFDHDRTRFILLNSTLGSLRLSEWDNLPLLRRELDEASTDRKVKDVVVMFHHPLHDPTGTGASQLNDPLEADLVQQWLSDFREKSGKNVAFFAGHAHDANVNRQDGLLEVTNPSIGKTPYGDRANGGFFGWELVGVNPNPAKLKAGQPNPSSLTWIQGDVRPLIDTITLTAPATLATGASSAVSATGTTTGFGLTFPLAYPASVQWAGANGLAVVSGADAVRRAERERGTVAVLDLSTMRLTGVRKGSAKLTVASGVRTATQTVTVTNAK